MQRLMSGLPMPPTYDIGLCLVGLEEAGDRIQKVLFKGAGLKSIL